MAVVVKMPKLSDTMTEGVVVKWHKALGDTVKEGELLAEIETDKATMEFESFESGELLHIGVQEGSSAPVDEVLAIFGKKGEDISAYLNTDSQSIQPENTKEIVANNVQNSAKPVIDSSKINAKIVAMPKLSDTMTEGVVVKWHKALGDAVKEGELLAEIETDKATMEFESFESGELLHIGIQEGDSAPVDSILAILGDSGTDIQPLINQHNGTTKTVTNASIKDTKHSDHEITTPHQVDQKKDVNHSLGDRILASPLAKKLAAEKNISLQLVKGSGYNGRIIKIDIENYVPQFGNTAHLVENTITLPLSSMRKTIARRLSESKFSAPHFYLDISINMDEIVSLRQIVKTQLEKKVTFNDFVVKAAAVALKEHPNVNVSFTPEAILKHEHVHIGIAVAVEEGLVVPVVKYADSKSLTAISTEVKTLAQKAKEKKIQPEDMQGNTFTISNLGMFDIDSFTSIINTPESCIMAVGAINKIPVVKQGAVVIGNIMKVTLSCDHRAVDGATGAKFLQTFKNLLEHPAILLGRHSI